MISSKSSVFLMLCSLCAACALCTPARALQGSAQHETQMHPGRTESHPVSDTARFSMVNDVEAQQLVLRVGPVRLPPHSDQTVIAQPRDFVFALPFDGWLVAYHSALTDGSGVPLPGTLLHHAGLWNVTRSDLLCPGKEEHIFGTGTGLADWPAVPGVGYAVQRGVRIRVSAAFSNATLTTYPDAYLELRVDYRIDSPGAAPLKSVYPMWMNVQECGDSNYALEPGKTATAARFTIKYPGVLLDLGGRLRDYGRSLSVQDLTFMSPVADLVPQTDAAGHLLSTPTVSFAGRGGYRLEQGQTLKVTASYDNPTGRYVPDGAMGAVVGYFLPDQQSELVTLERHPAPDQPPPPPADLFPHDRHRRR